MLVMYHVNLESDLNHKQTPHFERQEVDYNLSITISIQHEVKAVFIIIQLTDNIITS